MILIYFVNVMNYILIALIAIVFYFYSRQSESFLFWRAPESAIHDNVVDVNRIA